MQPNEKALYIIDEGPHGENQLCLHVTDSFQPGFLCFHDTNRGHMIEGAITKKYSNGFHYRDAKGYEWVFREVTIQEFRHHIYKSVNNGREISKLCTETEDLWEYYRHAFPL